MSDNLLDDRIKSYRKRPVHFFEVLHYGWLIAALFLVAYSYNELGEHFSWSRFFDTEFNRIWRSAYIPLLFLFAYYKSWNRTISTACTLVFASIFSSLIITGILGFTLYMSCPTSPFGSMVILSSCILCHTISVMYTVNDIIKNTPHIKT